MPRRALELALACDVRVAVGDAATRLGFPQVASGATPCWGGTVRLPRLIGLRAAIDLLVSGRKVSAAQARSLRLVDYAFPPSTARAECDKLLLDLQADGRKPRHRRPWLDYVPVRQRLLRQAWDRVQAASSPDHKSAARIASSPTC